MSAESVTTRLYPAGILNTLSRKEVERLTGASQGDLAELVRRCSLAVLNSGNESDDAEALLQQYEDFRIEVQQVNRGLRLELNNAPGSAFVDGQIIEGIRELISAVIRDLVYYDSEISGNTHHDLLSSSGITNAVFEMLRNARALIPQVEPDLVEVRVVPLQGYREEDGRFLSESIEERTQGQLRAVVVVQESIEREASGKIRLVKAL